MEMMNFNNEEKDIYEMYKGETKAETLENLQKSLSAAPEEAKDIIQSVLQKL